MAGEKSYLGKGWAFPPAFDPQSRKVIMVAERQDIEQSLEILLETSLGERVMQPEYGCNLKDYLFETVNASVIGIIRNMIENAILYHEPRIKLDFLEISDVDSLSGVLQISVDYFIRGTNSRFNWVYDFYLKEGIKQS